jgi:hypothetical protein
MSLVNSGLMHRKIRISHTLTDWKGSTVLNDLELKRCSDLGGAETPNNLSPESLLMCLMPARLH